LRYEKKMRSVFPLRFQGFNNKMDSEHAVESFFMMIDEQLAARVSEEILEVEAPAAATEEEAAGAEEEAAGRRSRSRSNRNSSSVFSTRRR